MYVVLLKLKIIKTPGWIFLFNSIVSEVIMCMTCELFSSDVSAGSLAVRARSFMFLTLIILNPLKVL